MALDPPFVAHMSADEQLYKDAELGIKIVYVLKYTVDEHEGMRLVSAGAVFHQLLDASGHSFMLHILNGLMSPRMATFGAFVAQKQAPVCPSPSPSSSSASRPQIRDNDVVGP